MLVAAERVLDKNGLSWETMVRIMMDGAPAMVGRRAGSQKVAQCGDKVAQYTTASFTKNNYVPNHSAWGT